MPDQHHQNIYELRSSAVQEFLRKPPAYLIVWANIVILVIIAVAFILLSVITLPTDSSGIYQTKGLPGANRILLATSLPAGEMDKLLPAATVSLYPPGDNIDTRTAAGVLFTIDSVYCHTDTIYLLGNVRGPFIQAYPSGKIQVAGAPESLRHRLFKKISL